MKGDSTESLIFNVQFIDILSFTGGLMDFWRVVSSTFFYERSQFMNEISACKRKVIQEILLKSATL